MESNKGFSYDLGFCRHYTNSNAEDTNDWIKTLFYYMTIPVTNHRLEEILDNEIIDDNSA
jgi:hypothetical protein